MLNQTNSFTYVGKGRILQNARIEGEKML